MVWYYRRLVCAHLSVCAHTSSSTLVTRSAAVCIERGLLKTFKVHHWRRKVLSGKKKSTGYWLAPYKPRVLVTLGVLCQPAVKRSCGARLLPSCARAATYDSTSTTPYCTTRPSSDHVAPSPDEPSNLSSSCPPRMERASETKGRVPGGSTCAHTVAAHGAAISGALVTREATHRLCTASAPPLHRLCTASAPPLHRLCTSPQAHLHNPRHRPRHRPGTLAFAPSPLHPRVTPCPTPLARA